MATRACGRVRGEGMACIAAGMNCVAAIAVLLTEMSCRACANEVADVSVCDSGADENAAEPRLS